MTARHQPRTHACASHITAACGTREYPRPQGPAPVPRDTNRRRAESASRNATRNARPRHTANTAARPRQHTAHEPHGGQRVSPRPGTDPTRSPLRHVPSADGHHLAVVNAVPATQHARGMPYDTMAVCAAMPPGTAALATFDDRC